MNSHYILVNSEEPIMWNKIFSLPISKKNLRKNFLYMAELYINKMEKSEVPIL